MHAVYQPNAVGHTVDLVPENISREMKSYRHWVVHREKNPYNPITGERASTTDSRTWGTFEEAFDALKTGRWDGIGFVFSSGDPYVGLDFDDCRDPETGEVDAKVLNYIRQFEDKYVEVSTSGTGLHLITRGKLREGARHGKIEAYGQERFFVLTGVQA